MWHSIYRHMALRQGVRSCTRHFLSHRRGIQQLSPLDILILKASEENERKPQRSLNIVGIIRTAKVIKHIPWNLLYDFRQLRIQISAHDLSDMNNIANLINHESLSISQSHKRVPYPLHKHVKRHTRAILALSMPLYKHLDSKLLCPSHLTPS